MGGQGGELGRVSNDAVYEFVDEVGEQPFFIWYAPKLPHYPFDAPQRYLDLFIEIYFCYCIQFLIKSIQKFHKYQLKISLSHCFQIGPGKFP